ncbi:hypothetical protein ETH_00018460 [Eimeria tenella]|uniref:Uncharacterized protein n=1 Tax=Eimeria tenella TaxID=5802 RepID=U6L1I4_EIMTE|nr:hypothetical protein ETH_00018460 [Eimeria tenella]CDJ42434.1 hypothetical protein ETH_00018460 [Eimeria tenella]|eukprot:XP_013233184.1 hypothetical protein ETH_00018460 [Eimeria tenella]
MVAELGQTVPFRGTVPFLAPEMEKEKEPPSPSKAETPGSMAVPRRRSSLRLRALPAHDVFALGLTLASVWFMSASSAVTFLWVDRCIRPYLLPGVRFTFDTLRSDVGPQVYTSHVRRHLSRCMSPGGKVDKLYLPSMPLLAKLKIKQMTESNHLIRISASNAFAFIAVAHALEKVRDRPPEEAQQLLRQAEGTVLLRLSLSKAGGDRIQVGTVKGKQQITDTLRALLELASWSPLREAVESVVAPVAEDAAVQLAKLPEAAAAEVTEAQDKLQQLLQWPQLQQQEGQMKDKTYADLIDAVLGVDLEGLNALTQQEITNRKLSVVNVSIAKSAQEYIQQQLDIDPYTQLIEETPAEQAVTIILKSVGIKDEGESEILTYFKERVFASYVAWASADRLVRLAVRRCASTDPAGVSVHQKYTAGEVVDAEEQQQARRCVWGQVTQITNETHYGLPWGVSAALSDFGSPEEQVSAVVRDVFTPLHMQSAWQTENALSLLQVQVARAVSRLCAVSIAVTSSEKPPAAAAATALPEAANLRSMYRTVLMEMQKDFIVPFAFGYEQERPEYTEVLFNLSLLEFKKAIIFAAAKKQLSVVAQETLQAMGTKQRSLATLSTLLPLLPESILTWQRYASDANEAQKVINETVENEIKAIKTPQRALSLTSS